MTRKLPRKPAARRPSGARSGDLRQDALELPFTKPTGYGLGKSGWVSATFETKDDLPLEILKGWIRESYCAVAPRKLVAELEGSGLKSLSRRSRSDRRG